MLCLSATGASTLVFRRTLVAPTSLTLVVTIRIAVVGLCMRSGVGLHVCISVGLCVRLYVGSLVKIISCTSVNVGTSTNVDRNRGVRMVAIAETNSVTIAPLAHLTAVQDIVQIASILIVPILYDIVEIDSVGIAIATACPLEIQIEEFRLLTCRKIKRHSHIAGHTLSFNSHSLATTTDGYFDSRCGVCGCGRCCIDGKDCRHCYC